MSDDSSVIQDASPLRPETDGLYKDACSIIEQAQAVAYRAVNEVLIKRNWLLGMRIQHEVLKDKRAEYGEQVIVNLSENLTKRYGRGFKKSNLYLFMSFYQEHSDIFQSMTGKLDQDSTENIFQSVIGKSEILPSLTGLFDEIDLYSHLLSAKPLRLSWTHYSIILQEPKPEARAWYENEAANEMWSTRLFAAKYLTYMPTKEELRREIEQQKELFRLQNG